MAIIRSNTINNTVTFRTSHAGFTPYQGTRPMSEAQYEAPEHVTAVAVGGRPCGHVGRTDGTGTYAQFVEEFEFAGARHGDVIRAYPWRDEYHIYKTRRGLVVDEVPCIR